LFKKGHKHSLETKLKISLAHKGKHVSPTTQFKKGHITVWTDEMREKLRQARLKNNGMKGKPAWNRGLKGFLAGEKSPHWKKDRTTLAKRQQRNDSVYIDWRKQVWLRDNFKCKIDNPDCSGRIEAHHILPWRDYPELRYQPNNGITLCHAHHPRTRAEEKRLISEFQCLVSV